jgi:DNA helicase-2/ATP-dependent DNA helicase PcrA
MRSRFGQTLNLRSRFLDEIPGHLIQLERAEEGPWGKIEQTGQEEREYNQILKEGSRIIHPTFGYGQIVAKEGWGENLRLTVTFKGGRKKRLLAKYADLEIVG